MTYTEINDLIEKNINTDFMYPIRLTSSDNPYLFLSKVNGFFAVSYPDARCNEGYSKKYNLTSDQAIKIIKRKIYK